MSVAGDVDRLIADVKKGMPRIQERTLDAMRRVAAGLASGEAVNTACVQAGVTRTTYGTWRTRYPPFGRFADEKLGRQEKVRVAVRAARQLEKKRESGLVYDPSAETPPTPTLRDFRWDYFGQPTEPHQEAAVAALSDMSNRVVIILGPTGPQPHGSQVLTPGGWAKIEDVTVGDRVIGRDGKPKRVTGLIDAGVQPVMAVTFDDATSVRAATSHTWTVKGRNHRRRGWFEVQTWEMAARVKADRGWNWQVPVVGPVEHPAQNLPLDPYLVGVLLGDGCLRQNSPKFTTADAELVDEVAAVLPFNCRLHQVSDIHWHIYSDESTRPTRLRRALTEMGMWGEYSHDKAIPPAYLVGSVAQRLSLLQGLMDTDGSAGERGRCGFTSTSYELADGVAGLVRSLGGWASQPRPSEREGRRVCWSLSVVLAGPPLFRLTRKQERVARRIREVTRKVVAVEPDGAERCVCLTVEDDHYVTDAHTVTHNSGKDTIAGQYLLWRLVPTRSGLRGAWFMESEDQSRKRLRRLSRYLVDPTSYRRRPEFTPGGQIPARSLIDDWGPFRWAPGLVHADGTKVEREHWSANAMYFLQDVAPEQDPNLWATGVQGATYGARIQEAVLSDIFTMENQTSPTERARSLDWVFGTLDSRLDEIGRLVVIGTMLPIVNNYEAMIEKYTADARVLRTQQIGPATYTKYSNGAAVVVVKAIVTNSNGEEESYWRRFPLESQLEIRRNKQVIRVPAASVSDDERLAMADEGVPVKWVEGLADRRTRDPRIFKAMFQQERDGEATGDFTEATYHKALDPSRTYEVAYPDELVTVGVDPAKHYGGAYAALAVDRSGHTITLVDEFWATRLGDTGIRSKLVQAPIVKWSPVWFCYEVNRHSSILTEDLTVRLFREFGVSVYDHKTTGQNRPDHDVGIGAIATYMRSGVFRLPAMTAHDRQRSRRVWDHFLAFDESTLSGGRQRPGAAQHIPDDLAFAIWPAFIKARVLLEKDNRRDTPQGMPVPAGLRQKWDRARKIADARAAGKDPRRLDVGDGRNAPLHDVVMAFVSE